MIKSILLVLIVFNAFLCSAQSHINQLPINADVNIHDISTPFNQTINQKKKTGIKTQKSLVWKWDTILSYDTSQLRYRYSQVFDNKGNVMTLFMEQRVGNAWENCVLYTYTYDSSGNLTMQLIQYWDNTYWLDYDRYSFTYNGNGNMLTQLHEEWQGVAWINIEKYSYTYDGNGNIITELLEMWQTNTWKNSVLWTYTYDIQDNILTKLQEYWDNITWVPSTKFIFSYDINGNEVYKTEESWLNNAWSNKLRDSLSYNGNNNLLTRYIAVWDSNEWKTGARYTYSYDGYGNLTTILNEELFDVWRNNGLSNYTYDIYGNSVTGKYDEWLCSGPWSKGIDYLKVYSGKEEIYLLLIENHRYEASFVSFNTNMNNNLNNCCFNIYPNPAINILTIELGQLYGENIISIYNLLGQLVLSKTINQSTNKIDISSLPNGLYLIKMFDKENTKVIKFVKE